MPPALAKTSFHITPALREPDHSPGRSGRGREDVMAGIGLDFPVCCVQLPEGWTDWGEGNRRGSCFMQEACPQSLETVENDSRDSLGDWRRGGGLTCRHVL